MRLQLFGQVMEVETPITDKQVLDDLLRDVEYVPNKEARRGELKMQDDKCVLFVTLAGHDDVDGGWFVREVIGPFPVDESLSHLCAGMQLV